MPIKFKTLGTISAAAMTVRPAAAKREAHADCLIRIERIAGQTPLDLSTLRIGRMARTGDGYKFVMTVEAA